MKTPHVVIACGQVRTINECFYPLRKWVVMLLLLCHHHRKITPRGINGRLALVSTLAGQTQYVLSLCVQNGKIETVYMLLNPEKLTTITT